jgi:hypothetical protein
MNSNPQSGCARTGLAASHLLDCLSPSAVRTRFREVFRDDRGAALVEYLVVSSVTLPLTLILFHPDNGFYQAARVQFDQTLLLLRFLGP